MMSTQTLHGEDLNRLVERIEKKLPKLSNRTSRPSKPYLSELAKLDQDFQWVSDRANGMKLSHALSYLKEQKLCVVCDFYIVRGSVCRFCLETPIGKELQIELYQAKKRDTFFEKYGCYNPSQSSVIKQQKAKTCLRNFGTTSALNRGPKREEWKAEQHLLHGTAFPTQRPEVLEKRVANCLEKRGVRNHMQDPSCFKKLQSSFRDIKAVFILEEEHSVRGYEPQVLQYLESRGCLKWVVTDIKEMPEIWYSDSNGTRRRYYPDFVFESSKTGNLYIVEVKSLFTLNNELVLPKAKAARQFCRRSNGLFEYAVVLYDKGVPTWIPNLRTLRSLQTH